MSLFMGTETCKLEGQRCLGGHQESYSCWDGILNMQREPLPELKTEPGRHEQSAGDQRAALVLAKARQKEKSPLLAVFSISKN